MKASLTFFFFFYISDNSLDKEWWELYKKNTGTLDVFLKKYNKYKIKFSCPCSNNLSLFRNWLGFKMSRVMIQRAGEKKLKAQRETVQRCVRTCVQASSIIPPRIMTKKCDKYYAIFDPKLRILISVQCQLHRLVFLHFFTHFGQRLQRCDTFSLKVQWLCS